MLYRCAVNPTVKLRYSVHPPTTKTPVYLCRESDESVWRVNVALVTDKTRLGSATRRARSATHPETSRSGIIAARHQRVLSARKSRQEAADNEPSQTRPSTAAVRRPATAWSRPRTAAAAARPGSSTSRLATSMDSVTYESERSRVQAFDGRQSLPSSPDADTTTTILTIDDNDDDYEQVTYIQCRSVD